MVKKIDILEAEEEEIDEDLMQFLHLDTGVLEVGEGVFLEELVEDSAILLMLN